MGIEIHRRKLQAGKLKVEIPVVRKRKITLNSGETSSAETDFIMAPYMAKYAQRRDDGSSELVVDVLDAQLFSDWRVEGF